MSIGSGLASQIGMAVETTYGTGVTVTRFIPHLGESIDLGKPKLVSDSIRANRLTVDTNDIGFGNRMVSGSLETELFDRDLARIFEHCLGNKATSGAGPYTHTITPADNKGKSMTWQAGRPGTSGTVHPFTWTGVKIAGLTIVAARGEIAKLSTAIIARDETTATGLASASYTAGITPYRFSNAALTIGGTSTKVRQITNRFTNTYKADRYNVGSDLMDEPIMNGRTVIDGEMVAEFEDLTAYNRWVNGTNAALVLTFTNGANTLTITENVYFDEVKANISGREVIEGTFPFVAHSTTDAGSCTIVIVDANSAG